MLHASETWSLKKPDLQHLQRNDRTMISQIYYVKPEDVAIRSLEIDYLDVIPREKASLVWTR